MTWNIGSWTNWARPAPARGTRSSATDASLAARPKWRLVPLGRLIAALALEFGRLLPGFDHYRAELTAATALSHELCRQLDNGFSDRGHGLNALGPQLGLAKHWSSTPLIHRAAVLRDPIRTRVAILFALCGKGYGLARHSGRGSSNILPRIACRIGAHPEHDKVRK